MGYFKVINLEKQEMGPFTVTDKGLKSMQESKALKDKISVIGACDEKGNLLTEIAQGNFTKRKTKKAETDKTDDSFTTKKQDGRNKKVLEVSKKNNGEGLDMDSDMPDLFKNDFKNADKVSGPVTHNFNNTNNGKEKLGGSAGGTGNPEAGERKKPGRKKTGETQKS